MNTKSLEPKLDKILHKYYRRENIFNAFLAVQSRNKTIDWAGALGDAGTAGEINAEPGSHFFLASITKMFTCAVIMRLFEDAKLDLDDPVAKYLPASEIEGIHVYKGVDYSGLLKIVHLLSQTSGLADYFEQKPQHGQSYLDTVLQDGDRPITFNEIITRVRNDLTPRFSPGEGKKAYYNDTNYQLLGRIIESVEGEQLSEVFDRSIFNPLELPDTYVFTMASRQSRPPILPFYYGNKLLDIPGTMSSFAPDGGIVSNLRDSLVFLRAFFDGALFSKDYLDRMQQWHRIFYPFQYGYGLMRFKMSRLMSPFRPSPELIGHAGSTAAFLFYCPEKDLYLSGTLNQLKETSRPFRLMLEVINAVG